MKYRHGAEINQSEYLERLIKDNNGLMPCFVQQVNYNKVEIDLIQKYANKFDNPKILHVGCGMAFDSIYLSHFYENIDAIEIDKDVVAMAKQHNSYLHGRLNIEQGDAFKLNKAYNLIFLDGISEYMPLEDTITLLKKCGELADYLIISATAYQCRDRKITNFHVYTSLNKWKKIIKQTNNETVEIYGIQYPLRFMNIARYFPILAKLFYRFNPRIIYIVLKTKK